MEELRRILEQHGQTQLLRFWQRLRADSRQRLVEDLRRIDWSQVDAWVETYVVAPVATAGAATLAPAPFYPLLPRSAEERRLYAEAEERGKQLLRQGRVAMFTVAGGQGTRLGFDGPKGAFPITPVRRKSLFQVFAERIQRYGERFGCPLHWYIMTSPVNDAATRDFFAAHDRFGLPADHLHVLVQGTMPCFDFDGRMLLAAEDALARAPDGHGGSFRALRRAGALADMAARGIDTISYFQVDNPQAPIADPLFIGLHHLTESEMSSRGLRKREPFEKLGCFCLADGALTIIEYSDLPEEMAVQRDETGQLRFAMGSPAIHVIACSLVDRLTAADVQPVYHRAVKKIPHIAADGTPVTPAAPNGVKLESFVFDALPLARNPIVFEADRRRHYSPVKNAAGPESPQTCRENMQNIHADWLAARGCPVPRDADGHVTCRIEISPRIAADEDDFAAVDLSTCSCTANGETYIS